LAPEKQQAEVELEAELEEEGGEGADRTSMYVSLFEGELPFLEVLFESEMELIPYS